MKVRHAAGMAGIVLVLMSGAAGATTYTYNYEPTSPGMLPSMWKGTFTTDSGGGITSFAGKIDGQTIQSGSGTLEPFPFGPNDFIDVSFIADNLGYRAAGFVNQSEGIEVSGAADAIGTLTVAAVPLPSSAPLFSAALLALGATVSVVKRKRVAAA